MYIYICIHFLSFFVTTMPELENFLSAETEICEIDTKLK